MSNAEKIKKLDEQLEQIKARKQALLNKDRAKERKARNHRLILVGAAIEKQFQINLSEKAEIEAWVYELYQRDKNKQGIVPEAQNQPTANEKTCPKCGSPMRRKHGSYGEFWGCSSHPACSYSEKI